jgi:hypothetical protein
MRIYIICLLSTFLLMTFIIPVSGQQNETREIKIKEQVSKIESAKVNLKPNEQKINSAVLQKINKMAAELNSGNLKSLNIKQRFSDSVSPVDDMGRIRVKLTFDKEMVKEDFELMVEELKTQGVEILTAYYPEDFIDWRPEMVCLIAYDQIKEIARDDRVKAVLTASDPISKSGDYETEGDAELFAETARAQKGVDGTGVRVGVVSSGAQDRSASISSGDLPIDIVVLSDDNDAEGTAMMEIIYDLAPGCAFTFASAGETSLNMKSEIMRIISSDGHYCKIVVDDIGWFDDPYFTDGALAQYIHYIIDNNNIIYISAAGNEAECLYSAHYNGDANEYHLFNTSGATPTDNWISLPASTADTEFKFYLQWADDWDEPDNDYDLYLYNWNDQIVGHATNRQGSGYSNPLLEIISYKPGVSSGDNYYLRIKKYSGEGCDLKLNAYPIHLQFVGPSGQSGPSDQIVGHPAAEGVISVAAYHTDVPNEMAPYSSRGPTKIYLGNYNFETRYTPTITATSNVETSIEDFRPFDGTSAAVPHIAGIAALYLDYYGYSASSPEDFYDDLTENADGIAGGTGGTWNKHSGYGKANALEALGGGQYPTIVNQKKSNGSSFDKIYHWESAWEDYDAPAEFFWSSRSNHSLKASTILSGDEKFHHWNESEYKVFDHFDISAGMDPIVSQFEDDVTSVTVRNTFADGFTLGTIEFKDPWLRDYYESPYGYRNQGMSAPLKLYTSPYSVSTGSGHQGVFLNQDPSFDPLLPNYSVGVPETMNFGGSIGNRKVYLINWSVSPDFEFATFQNSTAQETGVVFHYPNATVSANLKASQLSNTSSAYSNNGQRKFIETKLDGITWLHQVYVSGNHVWLEHSSDGGATWILGNNGHSLDGSSSGAKNPSIAYTYQTFGPDENYYIGIVWQEKNGLLIE